MTLHAKILLLILALPLILLSLCLILPFLFLALILGIFFPALRSSFHTVTMHFPRGKTSAKPEGTEQEADPQVCDVECTVLHAENVPGEEPGKNRFLK